MTESERSNPFNESFDTNSAELPDGEGMGLTKGEQLSLAIQETKALVIACPTTQVDRRRQLVGRLVQLRLQLSQLNDVVADGDEADAEKHTKICHHQFELQDMRGRNPYCEYCLGMVWRLIQPWYRCRGWTFAKIFSKTPPDCGYRAHGKCLSLITRTCAAERCREEPNYITEICPSKGLAAQNYRCAECRTALAFHNEPAKDGSTSSEPRLCDYSGKYFCPSCHWNDQLVIPARVVHNWDFTMYPVARYLDIMQRRPLIKLESSNAMLMNFVQELRVIKEMRKDILIMKVYFMACHKARKERILWNLKRHQYFVDTADTYSLSDLVELNDGILETEVRAILRTFVEHISGCETCAGNGFVCELCADNRVIFPFNDNVYTCKLCLAVFHAQCMMGVSNECPRCARRLQRDAQIAHGEDGEVDVAEEAVVEVGKVAVVEEVPANPFDEDIEADQLNPFLEDEETRPNLNPFH